MTDPTPRWLEFAERDIGQRAIKGAEHNPAIVMMFARAGFPSVADDETAACAAGVGSWLSQCGIQPSGSLMAASYKTFGVHLDEPQVGCIGVVQYANGGHHVGIVTAWTDDTVTLIGANQGHSKGVSEVNESIFKRRPGAWTFRWPVPLKNAAELKDEGSRHIHKGNADQTMGWVTTLTAGTGAVAAVNQAGDASAGLLTKMLANPWPWCGLMLGVYLIASGTLVKLWRVADANMGRKQ